jgi:hypothetical protein
MNRVVNSFTFLALGIYCFLVFVIVSDLSFSTWNLKGLPYKFEIITTLTLIVLMLGLIRTHRRWQGTRDMKRYSNFIYVTGVDRSQLQQGILVTSLEVLFFIAVILFCTMYLELSPEFVLPMIGVLAFISLESLVFIVRLAIGGTAFRAGFNEDVIAYFDREMHLFYYTGLQRVELNQKDLINFQYRDGLHITFATDAIPKAERKVFRDALVSMLETKNVYIDDSFRNWQ